MNIHDIAESNERKAIFDMVLEEACRQWCGLIDESPEKVDGKGFAKFFYGVFTKKEESLRNIEEDKGEQPSADPFMVSGGPSRYSLEESIARFNEREKVVELIHEAIAWGVLTAAGNERIYVMYEEDDGDSYWIPMEIHEAADDLISQNCVEALREAVDEAKKKPASDIEVAPSKSPMREAADLQADYRRLVGEKQLTKKALCDLCVPFRDKYSLTDSQTLRIARKEMALGEMVDLLEGR